MNGLKRLSRNCSSYFSTFASPFKYVKSYSNSSRVFFSQQATLIDKYQDLIVSKKIKEDKQQWKLIKTLERLRILVEKYDFSALDLSLQGNEENTASDPSSIEVARLRGIYIFGPVGSGKSMLMDLFFDSCQIKQKRRVHFHQFMLEIHQRIYRHKQSLLAEYGRDRHINLSSSRDSIKIIAKELSQELKLLCFDEFQVTDIADAVILTRFFKELWKNGVILVATSNRPPSELYENGLNRKDFLPFIEQLEKECLIKELNNNIDYRTSESIPLQNNYFLGNTSENYSKLYDLYKNEQKLLEEWNPSLEIHPEIQLIHSDTSSNTLLDFMCKIPVSFTRFFLLENANPYVGMCFLSFQDTCETDKGASDYKALTRYFHSVFMTGIPKLNKLSHNSARRFIIFIDEMYNHNIRFLFTSEVEPAHLFDDETEEWKHIELPEMKDKLKVDNEEISKYGRNYESSKSYRVFFASITFSSHRLGYRKAFFRAARGN